MRAFVVFLLIPFFGAGLADARTSACGSHQNIVLDRGFMLSNNNWGSEGVDGSPFQCVYLDPDGTIGWHWDRPTTPDGTLPDFPQIMHGPKPFGGGTGQTTLLPIQVKDIDAMQVWRDGTHEAPGIMGPWSHTISLWFTQNRPQGHNPDNVTHEVMINIATMNYHWGRQPNLNDGHRQYDHTGSSPMGHWRIHIFNQVDHQKPLPKQINIKAFLDYLVQNETLTGDDWLAAVELGDEMNDNTHGEVHLTTFAIGINGVRRSPTPELVPAEGRDEWEDWNRIDNLPASQTVAEGVYRIRAAHTKLPVGVENASTANGAAVRQLAETGGDEQLWELSYVGNGQYEIAALHSGKLLEAAEGEDGNGVRLRQWERVDSDHQRWHVEWFLHNRRYRIAAAHSRLAAEVGGGSQTPGSHLQQWEWFGRSHQYWELELVSEPAPAPTIGPIADRTIDANTSTGSIAFTVGHEEADPSEVVVSGSSSDTTLVPNQHIVFGGTGADRIVHVVPATNRLGTANITVTAAYGERTAGTTFALTVTSDEVLIHDFDDGTMQEWTDLTPANQNSGPRNWALSPPAFPGRTRSGAGAIGQHIVGGTQDSSHPTLWLRSAEFVLDRSRDITVWLSGGAGSGSLDGVDVAAVPANTTDPGFLGVALRNADTGTFVLSRSKNSSGDAWEEIVFSAAELANLDPHAVYTLDLIDAAHGGWGWVAMDSVTIPGMLLDDGVEPEVPVVTIRRSGGNEMRLSWPIDAAGWTLRRSSTAGGEYGDAGLEVTVEGDENVVYDAILPDGRFYRLVR